MSDIQGDGFSEVLSDAEPNPRATMGDNHPPGALPPLPSVEDVRKVLGERHAKLFVRAKALLEAEKRMPADDKQVLVVADAVDLKKFGDTVRMVQAAHKELDVARTAEKQGYQTIADAVHGLFREVMDDLVDPDASKKKPDTKLKGRLEAAMTRYNVKVEEAARKAAQDEADRKRAEEDAARKLAEDATKRAEELAAEAARKRNPEKKAEAEALAQAAGQQAAELAAAATTAGEGRAQAEEVAAAPAADLTRTRGGHSVSSLQAFLDFRDIDRAKLPAITLWPYLPADAIEKAVRAYMTANSDPIKAKIANKQQPITGVLFFINHRTTVR